MTCAAIISNDVPTDIVAGQTYVVHIAVLNTGTTVWMPAEASLVSGDLGSDQMRAALNSEASVAPTQTYTFTLVVIARATPRNYTMSC